MSPLGKYNRLLRDGLAEARNDPAAGLAALRRAIDEASAEGDVAAAGKIARHEAVIATHLGELAGAIELYGCSLAVEPHDPLLHLAVGMVYEALGDGVHARAAYQRGQTLAESAGDADALLIARKHLPRE